MGQRLIKVWRGLAGLILVLGLGTMVRADSPGPSRLGRLLDVSAAANFVEARFENGRARFSTKGPGLMRVRAAAGEFSDFASFAVDPDGPAETAPEIEDRPEVLVIDAPGIRALVNKRTGAMDFLDGKGDLLMGEPEEGGAWFGPDGVGCDKKMPEGERYYGFGEKTGPLDKRGQRLVMWNSDMPYFSNKDPLYQSHPMFMAIRQGKAYGIFFDNSFRSVFDMGKSRGDRYRFEAAAGELDYWVMAGPRPADVLEGYGRVVGTMPVPPLWGIGYHQCRWSYRDEPWVREVWQGFRERDIPIDALYLDIHYMEGYRVFTFNHERFPDPKGLIEEMREDGIRTVVIVDPGVKIDEKYPAFQEIEAKGYYVRDEKGQPFIASVWPGKVYFPDFLRPEVRQWWGDWHKFYTDLGVAGIWNDMNEPAGWGANVRLAGYNVPLKRVDWLKMRHGDPADPVPHARVHNVYGLLEAQATYEGLLRQRPNERPFIISRAGFPGLPRHALIWTGDNFSTWGSMRVSAPMQLNMGLTGLAFVGSDIGGFGLTPSSELYARWIQLGVFYPFCRTHTSNNMPGQEPWSFGDKVTAISRECIKLRYRLLPYSYAIFEESSRTNAPVMRAMVFEFPDDLRVADLADQFMWGPSIMVAPVLENLARKRDVYFPAGVWYDYHTKEKIAGPRTMEVDAPLEKLPLYARGGAIIPLAPEMKSSGAAPWDPLTVEVYPGDGPSSFTMYEDDKESLDYRGGAYRRTAFICEPASGGVTVKIEDQGGDYDPGRKSMIIMVYGQDREMTASAACPDSAPAAVFDEAAGAWRAEVTGPGCEIRIAK